jgi:hypothetical protein
MSILPTNHGDNEITGTAYRNPRFHRTYRHMESESQSANLNSAQ